MKRTKKLQILVLISALCAIFAVESKGQSSVEVNLNVSSEIQSGLNSPDIQSELELGYRNRFYHIKNDLYLFGKVAGFYQLDSISLQLTQASDATQYDYSRYGGSVVTGFFLEGQVLNAELGFGLTRHQVAQNKTQEGLLPPGRPSTAPDRIEESFNTFDVNLALMYSVINSFDVRFGFRLQSPLDQNQLNNHRFSPSLGLIHTF